MKKKEIIKLIEANLNIIKSNELLENIKTPFDYLEEQQCFLDIAELKLQFGILRKEVKIGIKKTEEAKKFIKTIKCNHEVRLNYYGDYSSYSICVLCGEKIEGDNILNWELRRDRNKYSIVLDAKDQYDYFIPDGYTNEDVYNIIFKILEDKELDEEVDLVQEFKKLNLKRCMINTFQKFDENFILIIGGSNKWYIDDESYITKSSVTHTYHDLDIYNNQEKDIISLKILSYFSGLLDTKVELLENLEVYQSKQFQNNFQDKDKNLNFKTYNTIEELDNKLEAKLRYLLNL